MGHFFEALMLICFGFSWPLNVVKAYKARTTKGTSLAFIILIVTGYIAGITAKFLNNQFNYVLVVYFINLAIVMSNIFVYIRNAALDKKQEEKMNINELNKIAQKNGVVLIGGSLDKSIPTTELAESFDFNFKFYNRSEEGLTVSYAKKFYDENVKTLEPEGIVLHIGDEDVTLFINNSTEFDRKYLELISDIKSDNEKCRLALVSVYNPDKNKSISDMNRHIKAIADSEHCVFVNLNNVKLWNPKGTKAASAFARNMGLNTRKPLNDVAEIIYSYVYLEAKPLISHEVLVG